MDFPRLLKENIAYGAWSTPGAFRLCSFTIYPQAYKIRHLSLSLGAKSYIDFNCNFSGGGIVSIGKFSCLAGNIFFNLSQTRDHVYSNVSIYSMTWSNFNFPEEFWTPTVGSCRIDIGSDVWIGLNSILKCTNSKKPLVIGDGAVIAADSVVVKNVPPYAIVGGNPAQIIKYRFPPDIIEALLRIKWWDWSLDKIHDNFKYFNEVEKFISLHDK